MLKRDLKTKTERINIMLLFELLHNGDTDYFTKTLFNALINNPEKYSEIERQIEHCFNKTKDESKRIFLLTQYLDFEILEKGDLSKEKIITDIDDNSITNFLVKILFSSIDVYEVAKGLIEHYKKGNSIKTKSKVA